jgi:hypothetical protein
LALALPGYRAVEQGCAVMPALLERLRKNGRW